MRTDMLDGLIAFRAVALARSFTAAAAQLGVSPQAVSQSVKALEARLGVKLFLRTTRSVALSEAGERLWARVGPALAELADATEAVQELRERPVGRLRLGVSRPAFSGWLLPALESFRAAFPEVELELSFDDGYVDIVREGLDAGVRLGDSVAQDMVSVPMTRREPIAIVGAPAYLQRRGVPTRIEDLAQHDCIRFRLPSSGTVFRWELQDGGRPVEVDVQGPVIVNETTAMLDCALAGLGLAYVLASVARAHIARGELLPVLAAAAPVLPGLHLYFPSRRLPPQKLRCFIDHMAQRLRAAEQVTEQAVRRRDAPACAGLPARPL